MRVALFCLLLAGCAKKPAVQHDAAKPVDSQVVIAPDAPVAAAKPAPADCTVLDGIMSNIHRAFQAKNTFAPRKDALKAWSGVPDACRNGLWYLEAALLFSAGESELTAGNVKIASEESALTLALQQPDHIDVLKRVALVQALGRKPALPADACKRAEAAGGGETAAYVCARAAIAAGDGKTAKEQLATIKVTRPFADYELAQAQAAKLNKDTKTMKAQAKLAMKLDYSRAGYTMIKEGDRKAIIDLAKSLK